MTPTDVRQTVAIAQKGLSLARTAMVRAAEALGENELAEGLRVRAEHCEDMEMSLALTEFNLLEPRGLA
jgi:hypothetical protein